MRLIEVPTENTYCCLLGPGLIDEMAGAVGDCETVVIIADRQVSAVASRIAEVVRSAGATPVVTELASGEAAKTPEKLAELWSACAQAGLTRSDLIIGVGGGATLDITGFCAATYLRGVNFISVPTTVLAMADAAVGGKTGIDLPEGKNLAGAFAEPVVVVMDTAVLDTLEPREVSNGLAEVIKCGFVGAPHILSIVSRDGITDVHNDFFIAALGEAIDYKAHVVAADLYEATSEDSQVGREQLNYGHTLGHAIEVIENYEIRHGEAVALGMMFAAELSARALQLDPVVIAEQRRLLSSVGLATRYNRAPWKRVGELMARDKKSRGSTLRFVGIKALGAPAIIADPPEDMLRECYEAIG